MMRGQMYGVLIYQIASLLVFYHFGSNTSFGWYANNNDMSSILNQFYSLIYIILFMLFSCLFLGLQQASTPSLAVSVMGCRSLSGWVSSRQMRMTGILHSDLHFLLDMVIILQSPT